MLLLFDDLYVHLFGVAWVVEQAVRGRDKLGHESFHFRQSAATAQQRLKTVPEVRLLTRLSKQTFNHLVPARFLVHGRVLFNFKCS
jgi:hypothetical protein